MPDAAMQFLMPCKPEQATREVRLQVGGQEVPTTLRLQGCEASGLQFTFGQMTLPGAMTASEAVSAWHLASLATLDAAPNEVSTQVWQTKAVPLVPAPERTRVMTHKHQVQWVWLTDAHHIYQAGVYGKPNDKGLPEAADTFFSGIQMP